MAPKNFAPTPAMRLYAIKISDQNFKSTDRKIAADIGISPETISRWKKQKGFSEWLENAVLSAKQPLKELLQQVAIENINDFRFWQAMAKKAFFLGAVSESEEGIDMEILED